MKNKPKLKAIPKLQSDKEAEDFVRNSDLTQFDLSGFKPTKFEFSSKSARINMRLPEDLLERVKKMAKEKRMPYTRFIRQLLERAVNQNS